MSNRIIPSGIKPISSKFPGWIIKIDHEKKNTNENIRISEDRNKKSLRFDDKEPMEDNQKKNHPALEEREKIAEKRGRDLKEHKRQHTNGRKTRHTYLISGLRVWNPEVPSPKRRNARETSNEGTKRMRKTQGGAANRSQWTARTQRNSQPKS